MATLQAPPQKTFPTVDQGTYIGVVESVAIEDHTVEPDKFGRKGHYTLIFRWTIEGQEAEDGSAITLPQYVRLETGERPYSKGPRAGKLPWLTEITRAFGEPDLQPGDDVDPDMWLGKRAKLSVLEQVQADGTFRNAINGVAPAAKKAAGQVAKPKPRQAPAAADDDPDDSVPF